MLRLDWNILINIINLLILYLLMKRFLFRPVNEILEKRRAEADSRFTEAREQEERARECRTKYESLLQEAQVQKEALIKEAEEQASEQYERIVEEAKEKAEGIVSHAREEAQKEQETVLQQTDRRIRDMVLSAAAKLAGESGSRENDRHLYDTFLESAGGLEHSQNGE